MRRDIGRVDRARPAQSLRIVPTSQAPRANFAGDPYITDGFRAVMWMSGTPVTYRWRFTGADGQGFTSEAPCC